ncbi:phosphoribosyltransferase family protein [Staphylococcus chromogenes]|nr:phosphoribosyltransferase family protein [Staphylococcus chromogenes]
MIELLLPKRCAGCGAPGQSLCDACRVVLSHPPQRIFTPVDPLVPVWAFAPYSGVHRQVVLGMKERGRRDVPRLLGAVVLAGLEYLAAQGEIPDLESVELVPAPTRRCSARLRGGDPVTLVAQASGCAVCCCVEHAETVADSVGLDASARRRNLAGGVVLRRKPTRQVVIVDDVVTTGATISATVSTLLAANVQVVGAIALAHA